MNRSLVPLAALVLLAAPARAQAPQPASGPLAETVLHIAESAEVTRAPDELVAVLRAEARAGSAAAAQEAVNRAVTAAVARARAVPELRVSTGGYATWRVEDGRAWQASQLVTLRGADAPAALELVGALQGSGLALSQLSRTLARDTDRAARAEASRLALEALRRRAAEVADQLGLQLVGLRELRVDLPERPMPRQAPMAMSASERGRAAPVAESEDVVVSAGVQAVAVLRPR